MFPGFATQGFADVFVVVDDDDDDDRKYVIWLVHSLASPSAHCSKFAKYI